MYGYLPLKMAAITTAEVNNAPCNWGDGGKLQDYCYCIKFGVIHAGTSPFTFSFEDYGFTSGEHELTIRPDLNLATACTLPVDLTLTFNVPTATVKLPAAGVL